MGTGVYCHGGGGKKGPGHEADKPLPSSFEVKNAWIYTFTSPIRLQGVALN